MSFQRQKRLRVSPRADPPLYVSVPHTPRITAGHIVNGAVPIADDGRSPPTKRRYVGPSLPDIAVHQDSGSAGSNVIYVGDSANFNYVLHEICNPFDGSLPNRGLSYNLQRHTSEYLGPTAQLTINNMKSEEEKHLHHLRVFDFPDRSICDDMIDTFFEKSYPTFPIFGRRESMNLYNTRRLSPLVQMRSL